MATILHSALTGSEAHEPKGADTASAGEVYVADGTGSGAWQTHTIPYEDIVGLLQYEFRDTAALEANTKAYAAGDRVNTQDGFAYDCVASGGDIVDAAGNNWVAATTAVGYASPLGAGAKEDSGIDNGEEINSVLASGKPVFVGQGELSTGETIEVLDGQHMHGVGPDSTIKALSDMSGATYEITVSNPTPVAVTVPAPLLYRGFVESQEARNGVEKMRFDGQGFAPIGGLIGLVAHGVFNDLMFYDNTSESLVLDGPQNCVFSNITCDVGSTVGIYNQTFNCMFHNLSSSEMSDGFFKIKRDTSFPFDNYFGGSVAPRNLTFEGGIHERAQGSPEVMAVFEGCHRIGYRNSEWVFSNVGGSTDDLTAYSLIKDAYAITLEGIRFQGHGELTFPNAMSMIDIDASQEVVVRGLDLLNFTTANGRGVRSIIRHRNDAGTLLVDRVRLVTVEFQKLIESENPSRVTYIPERRSGPWSTRPTDWIEATVEFTSTDYPKSLVLRKSPQNFKDGALTAGASSGSSVVSVGSSFGNGVITGDQIGVVLDDGSFFHSTAIDQTATTVTLADNLPSDASLGNSISIGGRWSLPNGLHYFGPQTYSDGDTTPKVSGLDNISISNTSATTITRFDYGQVGQRLTVEAKDDNTTIANGGKINTGIGHAIKLLTNDRLVLELGSDFVWYVVSRPVYTIASTAAQADLEDVSHSINTHNKYAGRQVYETTNKRTVWATSSTPSGAWTDPDGTIVYSPS